MSLSLQEFPGLSIDEVAQRKAGHLQNASIMHSSRSYLQILITNVFNLYSITLFIALIILTILGGSQDALFAGVLLSINIAIGLFQEVRAKQQLDALAALQVRQVHVRRAGKLVTIDIEDVVQDDLIELYPGDPLIVDGTLLFSDHLELDESSLTGESEYVAKKKDDHVLSGAYCVTGQGVMRAEKVGTHSHIGQLHEQAKEFIVRRTPVEMWLSMIFKVLMVMMIILGPLTILSGLSAGLPLTDVIENMINLVSSLVPQGLIVSVMISFAYGAIRISRKKTLVQRINAVESMGHVTVLCMDKTGTLTKNQLHLEKIIPLGNATKEKIEAHLSQFLAAVSSKNSTAEVLAAALKAPTTEKSKVAEVPFSSARKWSGIAFSEQQNFFLGAPEILLSDAEHMQEVEMYAKKGMRVLVFASSKESVREGQKQPPTHLTPLALIVLSDQLRADITKTLKHFCESGVGMKIISGDAADTVRAVAEMAKMDNIQVTTQDELEKLSEHDFEETVFQSNVFARITPSMKRRIIQCLNDQGFYTAMVGDGVNDVAALKAADVAIAMNDGAQITKDVADLVLLENAFAVLPDAMVEGHEITQRLYAVAKIFFIKVVYLSVFFLLIGFTGFSFPLSLRQSTWIAFITVGVPTALIALRFLNPLHSKSFAREVVQYSFFGGVVAGLVMTVMPIVLAQFAMSDVTLSRTVVTMFACFFGTYVLFDIHGFQIRHPRTFLENWSSALIILFLGVIGILVPLNAQITFDFLPLSWDQWLMTIVLSIITIFFFKYVLKRFDLQRVLHILAGNISRTRRR